MSDRLWLSRNFISFLNNNELFFQIWHGDNLCWALHSHNAFSNITSAVTWVFWGRDNSVLEHQTHNWKVPGLSPGRSEEWWEKFILQGQLSVLTLISLSVPPPCYCSSPWKILVILPKVHRWQVTAKHVCTLCMWICMKWCKLACGCMVCTECTEAAAVSNSAVSTLVDIQNAL